MVTNGTKSNMAQTVPPPLFFLFLFPPFSLFPFFFSFFSLVIIAPPARNLSPTRHRVCAGGALINWNDVSIQEKNEKRASFIKALTYLYGKGASFIKASKTIVWKKVSFIKALMNKRAAHLPQQKNEARSYHWSVVTTTTILASICRRHAQDHWRQGQGRRRPRSQ